MRPFKNRRVLDRPGGAGQGEKTVRDGVFEQRMAMNAFAKRAIDPGSY